MQFQIQILIASYAFLLLVFLLSRKNKLVCNKIFSWFIGSVLLSLLFDIFSELEVLSDRTNINSFIGYLYGPLLLFYVRAITNVTRNEPLQNYIHFVPAFLILSVEVLLYFRQADFGFPFWKMNLILVIVHVSGYTLKVFHLVSLSKAQKSIRHLLPWLRFLSWGFVALLFIFSMEVCIVLFEQFRFFTPVRISSLFVQLFYMNVMVYFGLTSAEIFNKKQKYTYSKLSPSEKASLVAVLEQHMKENEPFLDFDLSIQSLSEQIDIDSAYLSQVINEHFGQNFKDFINTYRIERAKTLLTGDTDLITKEVMYNSGFQSKSTFNPVFKRHTGMNPSQFRSWLKENNEK